MKRYLFSGLLLYVCLFPVFSQELGIGIGGNISSLKFTTYQGYESESIKGLPASSATISYGKYLTPVKRHSKGNSSLLGMFTLGYRLSRLKDQNSVLQSTWNMHFLTIGAGVRMITGGKKDLRPYIELGGTMSSLMSGTQLYGYQQYDLKDQLKNRSYSLYGIGGIAYSTSENSYITLGLNYLKGLTNLDKDPGETSHLNQWEVDIAAVFITSKGNKSTRSRRKR